MAFGRFDREAVWVAQRPIVEGGGNSPIVPRNCCRFSRRNETRKGKYFDCVCQFLSCFFNGGKRLCFFQW